MGRQSASYGVSTANARESFGKVKVNLEFLSIDKNYQCIMLSSAVAGEGKSTVAANLAVSIAASEKKTLLVDADLRHPTQHRLFDVTNTVGLSDVIVNNQNWRDFVLETNTENLYVLTAGREPPNPAELLGSNRMGEIVREMKNEFDLILMDSSPILLVPDPISLTKHADGVVIIARYNFTTIQAAADTREALQLANKPIIGTILNNIPPAEGRYRYGYGPSYGKRHGYYPAEPPAIPAQRAGK